jgi:dienelactone hydrolase
MMSKKSLKLVFVFVLLWTFSPFSHSNENSECHDNQEPIISFVEIQSVNLGQQPPGSLTVKGKLKLPVDFREQQKCFKSKRNIPAVVILHGSSGIDSRGDFYARALNAAGIATLEIDMWEARGLTGGGNRPPLPIFTYPDAFAALAFLSNHYTIDPHRIGVLGFSWGGVIALASAEELYAKQFGKGLKFAAHVAHYPVCYGYNNPTIPALNPPAERGTQFLNLTGAPVLIQIGTEDDYDNGADNCYALIDDLMDPDDRRLVDVVAYEGAYHAWDRLQVPITVFDPFADEGSIFSTGKVPEVKIVPDVDKAYASRKRAVQFFIRNL